jgi:hypothetical protein
MTTVVTVRVNGHYRAQVTQHKADGTKLPAVTVEGSYDRSPNPTGTMDFNLGHPPTVAFEITEQYLGAGNDPAADHAVEQPADETKPEPKD